MTGRQEEKVGRGLKGEKDYNMFLEPAEKRKLSFSRFIFFKFL